MGYKPRPSRTALCYNLGIVAIGHWETLNGHRGTIRPLVACSSEVSRITAPKGAVSMSKGKIVKTYYNQKTNGLICSWLPSLSLLNR